MDWAQLLVIILAVLFAIFLIVAIVLAISLISITKQIKAATASAGRTVSAIEDSVNKMNKAALPIMLLKGIMGQVQKKKGPKQKKGATSEQE